MKSQVRIGENRLEMTRLFDAPRARVFEAWTKADLLSKWWGCRGTRSVQAVGDFRPGGAFCYTMRVEGAGTMDYSGTYEEVDAPRKIAYRVDFGGSSARVTVEFFEEGSRTRLVLTQEGFPGEEFCRVVSEGFTASFERLDCLLAGRVVEA